MGQHPSAKVVYGFSIGDDGNAAEFIDQFETDEREDDEDEDEEDDDLFSRIENFASERDLEMELGYSYEDSEYIICAKEPKYTAGEAAEKIPEAFKVVSPEDANKLAELARKGNALKPCWLLIAFHG